MHLEMREPLTDSTLGEALEEPILIKLPKNLELLRKRGDVTLTVNLTITGTGGVESDSDSESTQDSTEDGQDKTEQDEAGQDEAEDAISCK